MPSLIGAHDFFSSFFFFLCLCLPCACVPVSRSCALLERVGVLLFAVTLACVSVLSHVLLCVCLPMRLCTPVGCNRMPLLSSGMDWTSSAGPGDTSSAPRGTETPPGEELGVARRRACVPPPRKEELPRPLSLPVPRRRHRVPLVVLRSPLAKGRAASLPAPQRSAALLAQLPLPPSSNSLATPRPLPRWSSHAWICLRCARTRTKRRSSSSSSKRSRSARTDAACRRLLLVLPRRTTFCQQLCLRPPL